MTDPDSSVDTEQLESSLATVLDIDVVETTVLGRGLNLNVAVSTPDTERAFVVRRRNQLQDAYYLSDIRTEYDLLQRLQDTKIPVPRPIHFIDDPSVLGEQCYVSTFLDGAEVPLGADLPERFQVPESRRQIGEGLIDTMVDIHGLDPAQFGDVCDHRTPREQVRLSMDRLDDAARSTDLDLSRLRAVGDWLLDNAPDDPETTLVHGDFRPGNVLFATAQEPEIAGVIDWETALLGDPLTDLAYLLLRWRDESDARPDIDELEARHPDSLDVIMTLRKSNERGLAPFTAKRGSPTRGEMIARYESRTGRSFDNRGFYRARAAFSLATVWTDIHHARTGPSESSDWPPYIDYMTMYAEDFIPGLGA